MHPALKQESLSPARSVKTSYLLGFLLGLHMALPAYVHSTFLSQFVQEKFLGIIFALASFLTIVVFAWLPKLLKSGGNFKVTMVFLILSGISALSLAFSHTSFAAVASFIVSYVSIVVLTFNHDLFLEHSSSNRVTGEIRGTYLLSINAAWVIAQLLGSYVLADSEYKNVFVITSIIALPMLLIVMREFRNFKDRNYHTIPTLKIYRAISAHKGIAGAYIVNFLLQFFFSWMIIYTPIYLHNHIGFEWNVIAVMFAIMLLPFVLLERPFGKLADRVLGEKELLVAGFSLMAITVGMMSFLTTPNIYLWTAILFLSRVGASTVEVMSETYFFKQVTDRDASLIGLFRTTRPWAYVIAPLIATLLLVVIDIRLLFLCLAGVMALGAASSLHMKDTL